MRIELNDPSNPPEIGCERSERPCQSREVLALTYYGWKVLYYTRVLGEGQEEWAYTGQKGGYVWVPVREIKGWMDLPEVEYEYRKLFAKI